VRKFEDVGSCCLIAVEAYRQTRQVTRLGRLADVDKGPDAERAGDTVNIGEDTGTPGLVDETTKGSHVTTRNCRPGFVIEVEVETVVDSADIAAAADAAAYSGNHHNPCPGESVPILLATAEG